jgi:hypothetical protein
VFQKGRGWAKADIMNESSFETRPYPRDTGQLRHSCQPIGFIGIELPYLVEQVEHVAGLKVAQAVIRVLTLIPDEGRPLRLAMLLQPIRVP